MKNTFILWKDIITNPFEGYAKVNDGTKVLWPLLTIILLFLISITMMVPMLRSEAYGDATVRAQIAAMAERGTEMSAEQQAAMAEQIKSPMVRNITVASSYAGGLIGFFGITLIVTLILKLIVSSVKKDKVKFSLVFKVILFASAVSMLQAIVKTGITVSGDWQRALARVSDMAGLQFALQSPVSLAALLDPANMSRQLYMLVDYVSDVFNWIYYILLYAGMKAAIGLEKKPALIITIVIAVVSVIITLLFTLIG